MTDTTLDQRTSLDDEDAPIDELPRRPRRKLVTPATAALTAVIIAAAGFVGGVEMQKSSATASTAAAPAHGPPASPGDRPAPQEGRPPAPAPLARSRPARSRARTARPSTSPTPTATR